MFLAHRIQDGSVRTESQTYAINFAKFTLRLFYISMCFFYFWLKYFDLCILYTIHEYTNILCKAAATTRNKTEIKHCFILREHRRQCLILVLFHMWEPLYFFIFEHVKSFETTLKRWSNSFQFYFSFILHVRATLLDKCFDLGILYSRPFYGTKIHRVRIKRCHFIFDYNCRIYWSIFAIFYQSKQG